MKILVVGTGQGSFAVRGKQLGAAIGARVTQLPTANDWAWADVVVLVKRSIYPYAHVAKSSGKTIVWDALDFWTQPEQNVLSEPEVLAKATAMKPVANLSLVIGATRAMADALGGVYLPHHSRPGLLQTPPRQAFRTVSYDGTIKYLGRWKKALEATCARLGLVFEVNPKNLSAVDLLVSFRDGPWDGEVCRRWKSGVKYVNAIAAGRLILTQPHAAFDEIQPEGKTLNDPSELEAAIEAYRPYEARLFAYEQMAHRSQEFALSVIAERYHGILRRAWKQAA